MSIRAGVEGFRDREVGSQKRSSVIKTHHLFPGGITIK
jgi:hypothetical protein